MKAREYHKWELDILAVRDLTMDYINKDNGLPVPSIKIKPVRRGRYHKKTNSITLPLYLYNRDEYYYIWYVIHECCHTLYLNHGQLFKDLETAICKAFGITIDKYAKAYPISINGKEFK